MNDIKMHEMGDIANAAPDVSMQVYIRDALTDDVYARIRKIAARNIRHMASDTSLTPTGVAHDAILKLALESGPPANVPANSKLVVGVLAKRVREVILNHIKRRNSAKRGSGIPAICLDSVSEDAMPAEHTNSNAGLWTVHLAEMFRDMDKELGSPQYALAILLKADGYTNQEAAEILGVSEASLKQTYLSKAKRTLAAKCGLLLETK